MKNKIIAICISVLVSIAFIVPASIFGEENALDSNSQPAVENSEQIEDDTNSEEVSEPVNTSDGNEVLPETESSADENIQDEEAEENAMESQMAKSPQKAPAVETEWGKLKNKIESVVTNGNPVTITIDKDVSGDPAKDKTIEIKSGQNVILKGAHSIKGIGYSSFKIVKGGSLTIDGPSISNAQIITEGDLILKSGKISDTKLEGPTIFVNSGTFTMNGGEVSGNKAVVSSKPQPEEIDEGFYAPITLYSGRIIINRGKITSNNGHQLGGAILALGNKVKSTIDINGGEINSNKADNQKYLNFGGAIFAHKSVININAGDISKNSAEIGLGIYAENSEVNMNKGAISQGVPLTKDAIKGGGLALINSKLNLSGGSINDNKIYGHGGGIYAEDSEIQITGGSIVRNTAEASGGAIALSGTSNGLITGGLFEGNVAEGFWGGGAIYNAKQSTLKIMNALITNNSTKEPFLIGSRVNGKEKPVSPQGGGIWNCPSGNTVINITNGLAIFENEAANAGKNKEYIGAGDDFANITTYDLNGPSKLSSVKLASRMLGGGYRLWYQDGSFQGIHSNWDKNDQIPRYNPQSPGEPLKYNITITEEKGAQLVYKSVPTDESKALAEQVATSVFRGNKAIHVGISGGAITNNGELEFGEDNPYTLKIMKSWTGDKKKDRPKEIKLQMFVGQHYIEDITLKESENWTTEIKDFPDPDTLIDNKTGKLLPINFKEKDGDKYLLSVLSREKDSQNLIYKIQLDNSVNTSVKVTKKWIDNENKRGLRPDNITVGLLANGKDTGKTLVLSEKTNWKGEFEKLPMYENDEIVKYEVKEISKIIGYTSKIEGNASDGYTITNTIIPDKTPKKPKNPETSDSNNLTAFLIMLIAAVILTINVYVLRKKQKM